MDKLRAIAESTHKEFVDAMHKKFGFRDPPGYATIEVRKMFGTGGLVCSDGKYEIKIGDLNTESETVFAATHESAHVLTPLIRNRSSPTSRSQLTESDVFLAEAIANFASLIFLDSRNQKELAYETIMSQKPTCDRVAIDLFESCPERFTELALKTSLRDASSIILPNIKALENTRYILKLLRKS
ncbi:MAG: hypothetical protein KGH94_04340 [Candidatus Micrarchaeota archaeon]|nr:hypothetical protein [Candidatus Micrarchaeota archaeon]